jgi:hypothetical protein
MYFLSATPKSRVNRLNNGPKYERVKQLQMFNPSKLFRGLNIGLNIGLNKGVSGKGIKKGLIFPHKGPIIPRIICGKTH